MKTILILSALITLAASSAFAAAGTSVAPSDFTNTGLTLYGDKTTADTTTALIGKTSTGVTLFMYTNATAYSAATQHKNGTKAFGSTSSSTSIFTHDETAGTITTKPPTDATADVFTDANGWKAM